MKLITIALAAALRPGCVSFTPKDCSQMPPAVAEECAAENAREAARIAAHNERTRQQVLGGIVVGLAIGAIGALNSAPSYRYQSTTTCSSIGAVSSCTTKGRF